MEKKKAAKQKETQKIEQTFRSRSSKTDPMGSYTGKPENPHEVPVQDADDL